MPRLPPLLRRRAVDAGRDRHQSRLRCPEFRTENVIDNRHAWTARADAPENRRREIDVVAANLAIRPTDVDGVNPIVEVLAKGGGGCRYRILHLPGAAVNEVVHYLAGSGHE